MTRTGRTLTEYVNMGAAGLVALVSFIENLPIDSALYRASHQKDEMPVWTETLKTNAILADIFDAFMAAYTKKGRQIKPYPRPQRKEGIGEGAVTIDEFWAWWNKGGGESG